jgi:hypothetical protein
VGTTPPADPTEQGSGNAAQKVLKTIAARVPITETQAIAAGTCTRGRHACSRIIVYCAYIRVEGPQCWMTSRRSQ